MELLKFCLDTTYFVYKNQIYKQKRGAAMGSPMSPIIASLYMEVFEERALSTAPHPPSLWFRYVDDTFTKIHEYYVEEFTRHINSVDPNIIFTTEPESNGVLPFLDACVHIPTQMIRCAYTAEKSRSPGHKTRTQVSVGGPRETSTKNQPTRRIGI